MKRKVISAATVVFALLIIGGIIYVRNTPHYSIYMLKRAIEHHDPDEALKYINIDSIIDKMSADFIAKNNNTGENNHGKASFKGMIAEALPGIKDSVRSSFREAVGSSRKIKRTPDATTEPHGETSARSERRHTNKGFSAGGIVIDNLDVGKLENASFRNLIIERRGQTAVVCLKDVPHIKARMVQTDAGHWQVIEITFQ